MSRHLLDSIKHFLENSRAVKFAYLFGSHARGNSGPLSDVDLAVYLDSEQIRSVHLSFLKRSFLKENRLGQ